MSKPVTLSLYGCGSRTHDLVSSVMDTGRIAVANCYDLNPQTARATAEKFGGSPVESVDELVNDSKSDAILIALFPPAHAEAINRALDVGKPIYAEKPIATNTREARAIVERVYREGTYVRVGFVQRYVPLFEKIRQMIEADELGELISIKHEWLSWPSATKTGELGEYNWRSDPGTGGELLQHTGHYFDVLRRWAGEFESVTGQTNHVLWPKSPSESSVFALLRHRDRPTISQFHLSLSSRYNNVTGRIEGSKLTLAYEWNTTPSLSIYDCEEPPGTRTPREVLTDFEPNHSSRQMMTDFLDDLEQGRKPGIPIEVGLRTLEVVEAIRESASQGQTIALPEPFLSIDGLARTK